MRISLHFHRIVSYGGLVVGVMVMLHGAIALPCLACLHGPVQTAEKWPIA